MKFCCSSTCTCISMFSISISPLPLFIDRPSQVRWKKLVNRATNASHQGISRISLSQTTLTLCQRKTTLTYISKGYVEGHLNRIHNNSDSSLELNCLVFSVMQTIFQTSSIKLASILFLYTPLLLSSSPFFSKFANSSLIFTRGCLCTNSPPL